MRFEQDVCGVFHLHHAPVVGGGKGLNRRAVELGVAIQNAVEFFDREIVGYFLGGFKIAQAGESIVCLIEGDSSFCEFGGQPVVAVKVKLKPEGTPSGNAKVTQSKNGIDEVEVIMQALARVWLKKSFSGGLIVPRFVGGAPLHGGKDVHQTGMMSTSFQNRLNAVFFSESIDTTDEFDVEPLLLSDGFSVGTNQVAERFGEFWVIEDTDVVGVEIRGHALGITESGQCALDNNAVPA